MTTQWGAPLTGAQMKLLRAAGLPDGTNTNHHGWEFLVEELTLGDKEYRLPDDHAAYTLLEKGWLDGRNVALWFGGDEAPRDLLKGSDALLADGTVIRVGYGLYWGREQFDRDPKYFIIAYIRKAEGLTTHADRVLADAERAARRMGGKFVKNEHWGDVVAASGEAAKADEQTVTIAKMTREEWDKLRHANLSLEAWAIRNGLIKPEPTREDRFWQAQPNGGAHVTDDVKAWVREALNFDLEPKSP